MNTALVTGAAGFIGFFTAKRLLREGFRVVGFDCMSDYYDVSLKHARVRILKTYPNYCHVVGKIEDPRRLEVLFENERPDLVIHLAAQAGVRYSIENPRSYMESNLAGTFEVLEAARLYPPRHMLMASTSSAYGANEIYPYDESQKADYQLSFYAATKKSTENMAHSYSHLFNIPITMFRFFTVYGPWGRPDMALFKFTRSILAGEPIEVYNYGKMKRDFTYIDDIVEAIYLLGSVPPTCPQNRSRTENDGSSPVAPWRVINIGNSEPVALLDFISAIEKATGLSALMNFMPMQAGDVSATWADTSLLQRLVNFTPKTQVDEGVTKFVSWFTEYYESRSSSGNLS